MGEIIPFPVWMIPFPLLKINFEAGRTNEKHLVKDFFFIRGLQVAMKVRVAIRLSVKNFTHFCFVDISFFVESKIKVLHTFQ